MEKRQKNKTIILIAIAVIVAASCLLFSCMAIMTLGYITFSSSNAPIEFQDELENVEEIIPQDGTGIELNNHTITPAQQQVIETAERIRGISAKGPFNLTFKTQEQLREQLIDDFFENTTEQDFLDEQDLMVLLGFIPEEMDLKSFYLDFYSEQIAGFYDTDENMMYLIDGGSESENSLTLAHEYTHFLQFDHFDFANKLNYSPEKCEENPEHCYVIDAVIEGDATLTEILLSADPKLNLYEDAPAEYDTSVFDASPLYYQNYLLFPYTYGYQFVSEIYQEGGFEAVDQLYENPPQSIEQIMHPEKYLTDEPVEILFDPFKETIAKTCEPVFDNVLNEIDVQWLLGSGAQPEWRLSEQTARRATEGWGGGAFQFARCDGEPLFFAKHVWDTRKDADEFFSALEDYSNRRWQPGQAVNYWTSDKQEQIFIDKQNDIVYLMIAPETFNAQPLINLVTAGQGL
jgi:hypothetical protein